MRLTIAIPLLGAVMFSGSLVYAERDFDPAPSGRERNEISVGDRSMVGHPGRDSGETRVNDRTIDIDFEKDTDAAKGRIEDFHPDDTSIKDDRGRNDGDRPR